MTTLTVNARGQVTFSKAVLQHLGIKTGEKLEILLLPDSKVMLSAPRQTGTIADFIGMFAGRTSKVVTIEEMNPSN